MVLEISTCHLREGPPSISFSGSGFLATYQFGVAQCLLTYAPWIPQTAPCVLGASAGSLVAAAVVCEMSPILMRDEMLYFAKQMKNFTLGPLNPSINVFHWLETILLKHIPSDAHRKANGRLSVAMTRLTDGKQILTSEYQSREDVVQALLCSCFVPGYCGLLPPSFNGVHYMDGGFSGMQPVLSLHSNTLTVSPFSGEIDICPADTPCMFDMVITGLTLKGNFVNSLRFFNALYPLALETLEKAYDNGYKDTLNFLLNNELVSDLIIDKVSRGLQIFNQTKTQTHPITPNGKEELKMKRTPEFKYYEDHNCMKNISSSERPAKKQRVKEPPLPFDALKNVLMENLMIYTSMFGLPAKLLSNLFLPLMLSFYAVLQSQYRLELLFRETSELFIWFCYGMRQYAVFLYDIFICTLKKNLKDRVMPMLLLLQWMKVHTGFGFPKGQRNSSNLHKHPSSSHLQNGRQKSLYEWLTVEAWGYLKTELQQI